MRSQFDIDKLAISTLISIQPNIINRSASIIHILKFQLQQPVMSNIISLNIDKPLKYSRTLFFEITVNRIAIQCNRHFRLQQTRRLIYILYSGISSRRINSNIINKCVTRLKLQQRYYSIKLKYPFYFLKCGILALVLI